MRFNGKLHAGTLKGYFAGTLVAAGSTLLWALLAYFTSHIFTIVLFVAGYMIARVLYVHVKRVTVPGQVFVFGMTLVVAFLGDIFYVLMVVALRWGIRLNASNIRWTISNYLLIIGDDVTFTILYAVAGGVIAWLTYLQLGGRLGGFGMLSWKNCGSCGKELPRGFRTGGNCPSCGILLVGTRKITRKHVNKPYLEKSRSKNHLFKAPRGSSKHSGETGDEHEFKYSENNPRNSPFKPPFNELFLDQAPIKNLFNQFINWAAVGYELNMWVRSIRGDPFKIAITNESREDWNHSLPKLRSEIELDTLAKMAAWEEFENQGFVDPEILPALYQLELGKIREKDRKVIEGLKNKKGDT
ncbi:MAG: hypothetical protein ACTSUE_03580 [Promethearchaeota archaeon]